MQCLHFVANWQETVAYLQVRDGEYLDTIIKFDEVELLKNHLVKDSLKFFGVTSLEGEEVPIAYNHINDLECLANSLEELVFNLGYEDKVFVARSIVKEGIEGALYLESFSMSDTNLSKLGKPSYKPEVTPFYKGKRPERPEKRYY
jgi:hypothetical protein